MLVDTITSFVCVRIVGRYFHFMSSQPNITTLCFVFRQNISIVPSSELCQDTVSTQKLSVGRDQK